MAGPSLNIVIPKNSFVQKASISADNCSEQISLCLPVYDYQDINFQFKCNIEYSFVMCEIVSDGIPCEVSPDIYVTKYHTGGMLVQFIGLNMDCFGRVRCGKCFTLKFYGSESDGKLDTFLFETNCFIKICDPCWTSKIKYRCDEDSFGFDYSTQYADSGGLEDFYNSIRLPFYLTEPQYPVKRTVFTKSDGSRKKLSARIENSYEFLTDYMPKDWHEKLIVALEHDIVIIDNVNSGLPDNSQFNNEKDYKIDWQRFLNYPTATASGQLMLTPYFNVNSNCK